MNLKLNINKITRSFLSLNNSFFKKINFFKKMELGFKKTKNNLKLKIKNFFTKNIINDTFFKEIEEKLLVSDFGFQITKIIIDQLIQMNKLYHFKNQHDVYFYLKQIMFSIINKNDSFISFHKIINKKLNIILVIGVNGVGKTTTIAKLAYLYKKSGKSVMLCAGDTFRAAASEQLIILGQQISIPVISKPPGSDPSSVIFDSIQKAENQNIHTLIIDTAGRLHNKLHLIEELKKNIRVIKKKTCFFPNEIFLILDACNGQNSIQQTKIFHEALKVTGIILTKLDGTAKGGVIFPILNTFSIPLKYLGVGEKINDLIEFNKKDFINTILKEE